MDFDLVVIGAGPGGYVAAIRASQLGLKTAIIEREALGGVCLNWGCIPTKTLLKSGEVYESLGHLDSYGLQVENRSYDFAKVIARSRTVAKQLSSGIAFLMKKNKIEVIEGTARLEPGSASPKVTVALKAGGVRELGAKNIILATGARARTLDLAGLVPDGDRIWSYREAMTPKAMPKSMIVIGSGAIGIEFASFYRAMGCAVTVVEAQDRILPSEDIEISTAAKKAFERRGIKFHLGASVDLITRSASGVTLSLNMAGQVQAVEADVAIVAIGITANTENLGLEALGVTLEHGHLVTDHNGATTVSGLYAIGDVAGPPWLAHKASHEGVACAEYLAGQGGSGHTAAIASCTYANPQVASVGLTEAGATAAGHSVKIGRFPFQANGKALAIGETTGMVKTVFDAQTGKLLGAHMIGAEVTELIQGFVIALGLGATETQLTNTVFAHPTLSEAMHESMLAADGRALHI